MCIARARATDPVLRSSKVSRRFVASAALGEQFPVHFPNPPVDNVIATLVFPSPPRCTQIRQAAGLLCRFAGSAGWQAGRFTV